MSKRHDYYQARAARQREIAAALNGRAREQHLTLAGMYEALATEPRAGGSPARETVRPPAPKAESERAYLERRAREERARASGSDDPGVRRIRFAMADEYLRRAELAAD